MKKILIIIALLIIAVFAYGLISWNFFQTPTFLSIRKDCFPRVISDDCAQNGNCIPGAETEQSSFWEKIFGHICTSE